MSDEIAKQKGGDTMKKFSMLLLVAVVIAGAVYVARAYAENGAGATSAVQTGSDAADAASQCPKNADCPRDCEGCPGQCANCPDHVDKNEDGQCDRRGACPSAPMRQGCSDHQGRSCGRHD